jgi:aspartate ammonia-lyase
MIEKMEIPNHQNELRKSIRNTKIVFYGKETINALNNFPISGQKPDRTYILSLVLVKKAAAIVNHRLNLLSEKKSKPIIDACNQILKGKHHDQFVVDPYQAGAGTSHNMNINEVIAYLSQKNKGGLNIHPNDDINMSQSTNDVIPTAIRLTVLMLLPDLLKNLKITINLFTAKSREFNRIIKSGRTHLQDALPVTLGQEFASYGKTIKNDVIRVITAGQKLRYIGIGGTGVGTGINTHPKYHLLMVKELSRLTSFNLKSSGNLLESANNTSDFLEFSGSLKILSQSFIRIGNDLRLLSSGPYSGLAEINLPKVQAGSSIMPGKVNPSIIEMLTMVCFQVIGFDQAILFASQSGQLELNVWFPLICYNLIQQLKLLTNAIQIFNQKCLSDIAANKKMCQLSFEKSSGVAAILNPYLGYDFVSQLVDESIAKNITLRNLLEKKKILPYKTIQKIFSAKKLTKPNLK